MFMKDIGKMIKHMGKDIMSTTTVQNIVEIGLKTSSMAKDKKPGLIKLYMKVVMSTVKSTAKENKHGLMDRLIPVISYITNFTEKEHTSFPTVDSSMVNGAIIRCMARVLSHGLMVENILVNTRKTRKLDMVNFIGLMVKNIKANGKTENKMDKEFLSILKAY